MKAYDGYLFDLDGTIYLGEELIPGADRVVAGLRERGARVLFLSNKPIARRQTYAAKLTKLGIPATPDDVVNSPLASARYLAAEHPGARVLVLGEAPLLDELTEAGVTIAHSVEETDIVLVAWDRQITWERLDMAHQALRRGARFFATNPDTVCPLEGGRTVPDAGANIAFLEASTGRKLEVLIGKPSPIITRMALAGIGLEPAQCLMVGDRLDTDIAMGQAGGLDTALVLTGVTSRAEVACSRWQPTYVLESVAQIGP
ncbi:MAG: HAD-IIA family hydrolase [Armatimonadota bacterium]